MSWDVQTAVLYTMKVTTVNQDYIFYQYLTQSYCMTVEKINLGHKWYGLFLFIFYGVGGSLTHPAHTYIHK